MISDKISSLKSTLEEVSNLYEESTKRYNVLLASFEKTKASFIKAQQYAPEVGTAVTVSSSTDTIDLKEEKEKILNLARREKEKAEKELQQIIKYQKSLKDKIDSISKQLGIISGGSTLKGRAEAQRKIREKLIKQNKNKVNNNDAKSTLKKLKAAMIPVAKSSIIYTLSLLFSSQLKQLSKSTQQLSELVDKTNTIIESVQTKSDIIKARTARNSALTILNKTEQQLVLINNILKVLAIILLIFKIILFIVTLYPIPTIPKIVTMITNAMVTVDALAVLIGVSSSVITNLISEIQYQKSRLLLIGDLIDKAIENDFSPEDINNILNSSRSGNYGKLGVLDGIIHRGFTFAIYEEDDPKFVVAGNKRRYAVAMDRSGFIVLYSQPSFTLDPEVLVEQLKLKIEIDNLEA